MAPITLLFATISITSSVVSSSLLCSNVTPTHLNLFYTEYQDIHNAYSLHECVKICRSLPRCKAFNYYRMYTDCVIQHVDSSTYDPSQLDTLPAMVFYDKAAWNMGPCSVHTCAADERCYPTGSIYVCKKAIDVCFNQAPEEVCFRRYEGVEMTGAGYVIAYTLAKCVIFCNKYHPTYKVIYFSLSTHQCTCRGVSVADFVQQVGPLIRSTGDTYEKIN